MDVRSSPPCLLDLSSLCVRVCVSVCICYDSHHSNMSKMDPYKLACSHQNRRRWLALPSTQPSQTCVGEPNDHDFAYDLNSSIDLFCIFDARSFLEHSGTNRVVTMQTIRAIVFYICTGAFVNILPHLSKHGLLYITTWRERKESERGYFTAVFLCVCDDQMRQKSSSGFRKHAWLPYEINI